MGLNEFFLIVDVPSAGSNDGVRVEFTGTTPGGASCSISGTRSLETAVDDSKVGVAGGLGGTVDLGVTLVSWEVLLVTTERCLSWGWGPCQTYTTLFRVLRVCNYGWIIRPSGNKILVRLNTLWRGKRRHYH